MADKYVGFRLPEELRTHAIAIAESHGLTLSQWIRDVIEAAVQTYTGTGELRSYLDLAYERARPLAVKMAILMLQNATAEVPYSYEEFVARYGDVDERSPDANQLIR